MQNKDKKGARKVDTGTDIYFRDERNKNFFLAGGGGKNTVQS